MPNCYEEAVELADRVADLPAFQRFVDEVVRDLDSTGHDAQRIVSQTEMALTEWILLDRAAAPSPALFRTGHGQVWEAAATVFIAYVLSEAFVDFLSVATRCRLALRPWLIH
jgi:hypothetical protein